MKELIQIILGDLVPRNIEVGPDDRTPWQKAMDLPFVKFRADIDENIHISEFAWQVENALHSIGYGDMDSYRVDGSEFWHIIIHSSDRQKSVMFIVSVGDTSVSVTTMPPQA